MIRTNGRRMGRWLLRIGFAPILRSMDALGSPVSIWRQGRSPIVSRKIIITDLTRFKSDDVCTAGYDMATKELIRPLPYIKRSDCERLKILPGAIIEGEFTPKLHPEEPHVEDHDRAKMSYHGPCSSADFKKALEFGLFDSIDAGFEHPRKEHPRCVPKGHSVQRSIITIRVDPEGIEVAQSPFDADKIRVNFTDSNGERYESFPLTDLGFYRYAQGELAKKRLREVNGFLQKQEEVLLRIGLARCWKHRESGIEGYWMQVNGIYTFPDYHAELRGYGA